MDDVLESEINRAIESTAKSDKLKIKKRKCVISAVMFCFLQPISMACVVVGTVVSSLELFVIGITMIVCTMYLCLAHVCSYTAHVTQYEPGSSTNAS